MRQATTIECMQVAMILPFMRLGEVILREKHLPLSPVSLKDIIFNHPGKFLPWATFSQVLLGECMHPYLPSSPEQSAHVNMQRLTWSSQLHFMWRSYENLALLDVQMTSESIRWIFLHNSRNSMS